MQNLGTGGAIALLVYGTTGGGAISIANWFPALGQRLKFGFIAVWSESVTSLYVSVGTRHLKVSANRTLTTDNFRSVQLGRNTLLNSITDPAQAGYSSVKYHALTTGLQTTFTDLQAAKLLSELSQGFLNIPPTITFS
jgi:hypothetical protein